MKGTLATLPMYDWPELRGCTDRLWATLREAFRAKGIAAPDHLDRSMPPDQAWTHPGLVLGQTCGMPYRQRLHGRVSLIGTPDYGVEGCSPGYYRSVIVVRKEDPRETLREFKGAVCAVNAADSESGCAAIMRATEAAPGSGTFFRATPYTGSHAASIRDVAAGQADIAAIDAVTWRFATQFEADARSLRVLCMTDPTPGLPYISACRHDGAPMAEAVVAGLAGLDGDVRDALGIVGFVRTYPADYLKIR